MFDYILSEIMNSYYDNNQDRIEKETQTENNTQTFERFLLSGNKFHPLDIKLIAIYFLNDLA